MADRRLSLRVAMLALVLVVAGCGGQRYEEAAGMAGATPVSPDGAFLAYEHDVRIQLEEEQIGPRVLAVQSACQSGKYGDCAVLQVSQEGGDYASGTLKLRTAPAGVEPLLTLAGESATITSRNTKAEDLAQQMADTRLTEARLQKEHARLQEFQARRDVTIADLLTIGQRMAEIEAGVEAAHKEAAQQRRRIDTQLLTVTFESTRSERSRSAIGEAVSEFGTIFSMSVAMLIRAVAVLLPVGLVVWVLVWAGGHLWRRRRARIAARKG